MVALTISPKRGNHARYFPHSGYLGLTPVVVTGVVETRLEEDNQPIQASKLIVRIRCYEAIGSSLTRGIRPEQQQDNSKPSSSSSSSSYPAASIINDSKSQLSNVNVLWQTEKTLWTAAARVHPIHDGDDETNDHYDLLGDWKGSWKLVIPTNAVYNNDHHHQNHLEIDQSTGCAVGSLNYKTWKSWWQVETVIYHKPAGVLGTKIMKSHGLYLINYGEAQKHYSRSIEESKTSLQSTTRMTNRNLRYSITAPSSVWCGDEVELIIRIGSSSLTNNANFNHPPPRQHQDRAIPTISPDNNHSQHGHQHRSPELVRRPTAPGRVNQMVDRSNQSDITLKRLQVSLIRRLAVELVKTTSSANNNYHPTHDGQPTLRIGNRSMKPFFSPHPPQINTIVNHTPIGTGSDNNNSKLQLTTFNTLTSNTAGISKSNMLSNLGSHHSLAPSSSSSPSQLNQDAYDLAFIVKLKIPSTKSKSHYSIGETFKTNSTTVTFFFQFQLSIKNKLTNRLEVVELSELNVQVFSISKDQIKFALDQLNKLSSHLNNSGSTLVYQNRLLLNPSSSSSSFNVNNNDDDNSLAGSSRVVVNTTIKDKFSSLG